MKARAGSRPAPGRRLRARLLRTAGAAGLAAVLLLQLGWVLPGLPTLRLGGPRARRTGPGDAGSDARQQQLDEAVLGRQGGGPAGDAAEASPLPGVMSSPAVIVFCYNRPDYLSQTLGSLLNLTGIERYALIVSQDGDNATVAAAVAAARKQGPRQPRSFTHWQRPRVPELGPKQEGHAWLAQHYRWGLSRLFEELQHSHAIIVEDDMLFSPDFLALFEATAPVLRADASLWCVSSWNDNGLAKHHAWDEARLFRTSFFPGLGWMMERSLWMEVGPHWPKDHWDHWMRLEETARGRDCLAPQVPRNRNIGEVGANMDSTAFKRYLKTMAWATSQQVDFGDLSYLALPAYEESLARQLAAARRIEPGDPGLGQPQPGATYLLAYREEQWPRLALRLGLWPQPRAYWRHLMAVPFKNATFLLANARFCPLLPPELRVLPSRGLASLAGARGQPCAEACGEAGLACSAEDFWFINNCTELKRRFPCEAGCTAEIGRDVPCYVVDPEATRYQHCLVAQRQPTCFGSHNATARLCACVPAAA